MPRSTSADANDPIPAILGANIKAYRWLRRLEQRDLSGAMREAGHPWHRATVSEIERAQRNMTVSELVSLVRILHTSIESILDPHPPVQSGLTRCR